MIPPDLPPGKDLLQVKDVLQVKDPLQDSDLQESLQRSKEGIIEFQGT